MKIFYAHTSSPGYIRVKKIINSISSIPGTEINFYGAKRLNSLDIDFCNNKKNIKTHIFKHPMRNGFKGLRIFIAYLFWIRANILSKKYDLVILTNEELFISLLFTNFCDTKLVLDRIDSIKKRRKWNIFLKFLINNIANYSYGKSNFIFDVENFRLTSSEKISTKFLILRNSPLIKPTIKKNEFVNQKWSQKIPDNYIFCYGSLKENYHNIETLIKIIGNKKKFNLVIAGKFSSPKFQKKITNYTNVFFLGSISTEKCLFILKNSIACFAHYNPNFEIHRQAAPNKYYENMALGKPLLINSECIITKSSLSEKFCITSPFNDKNKMEYIVNNLHQEINKLELEKAKEIFKKEYSWDIQSKKLKNFIKNNI